MLQCIEIFVFTCPDWWRTDRHLQGYNPLFKRLLEDDPARGLSNRKVEICCHPCSITGPLSVEQLSLGLRVDFGFHEDCLESKMPMQSCRNSSTDGGTDQPCSIYGPPYVELLRQDCTSILDCVVISWKGLFVFLALQESVGWPWDIEELHKCSPCSVWHYTVPPSFRNPATFLISLKNNWHLVQWMLFSLFRA